MLKRKCEETWSVLLALFPYGLVTTTRVERQLIAWFVKIIKYVHLNANVLLR